MGRKWFPARCGLLICLLAALPSRAQADTRVVIEVLDVHCIRAEDVSGDEFYIYGLIGNGRNVKAVLTRPIDIDDGQTRQLRAADRVLYDGYVSPSSPLYVRLDAYDEDCAADWDGRLSRLDEASKTMSEILIKTGDPIAAVVGAALDVGSKIFGFFCLGDKDDLLGSLTRWVSADGSRTENVTWHLSEDESNYNVRLRIRRFGPDIGNGDPHCGPILCESSRSLDFGEVEVGQREELQFTLRTRNGQPIPRGWQAEITSGRGVFEIKKAEYRDVSRPDVIDVNLWFIPRGPGRVSGTLSVKTALGDAGIGLHGTGFGTPVTVNDQPGIFNGWYRLSFGEAIGGIYFSTGNRRLGVVSYAVWQGALPHGPGRYRVEVFIPRQPSGGVGTLPRTDNAQYRIEPGGPAVNARISQRVSTSQWIDLGTYEFGSSYRITLTDETGEPRLTRGVVADAVRLTKQ